jgi:Cu+-exporting ATPase
MAIVNFAQKYGYELVQPESFTLLAGSGIQAKVGEHDILVGNARILEDNDIQIPEDAMKDDIYSSAGKTLLFIAIDHNVSGYIAIADQLKPEVPQCVANLREMGLDVVMLTGDHPATAQAIAKKAGIDDVIAQVMPDEKRSKVEELQRGGRIVAMVGDGINDAPALVQADTGIAMGTGTDIAIESGDIVVMKSNLDGVITALSLSRAVMRNIRQNLFWAFAYNVVGIPVAMGLLYIFGGPALNPMIAGAAMALSSVSVVSNALRLRFFSG